MPSASPSRRASDAIRLFHNPQEALFISRPNRFLVICQQGKKTITAHLPNPGRLQELLLPGRRLFLITSPGKDRKNPYTVVAVRHKERTIMLDTLRTNAAARALLERDKVPGLAGAQVVKSEVRHGHSRFDFLLEHEGEELYLEVKSVTLAGEKVAMFPDAVTTRGTRHLTELADLAAQGKKVAVLFLVHVPHVHYFMPDYHTDLRFAQTFLKCRHQIRFLPVAVKWGKDLSLRTETSPLVIPWSYLKGEVEDRGAYLLVLRLAEETLVSVGRGEPRLFKKGYYIYVGSAMANLSRRLERHRRVRKRLHWHIDYLKEVAEFRAALPIRSSVKLECPVARALSSLASRKVKGFGCTDCNCESHLFGFESDPLQVAAIQDLIVYFRMDRGIQESEFTL